MTTPAVTVADLHKAYGDTQALRGVEFEVSAGEIFGLVGPNGAGKSTTLRIMSTLLNADSGDVTVFGANVATVPNEARAALRYVPEEAGAYENLTGRQYLDFVADFYDGDAGATVERGVTLADLGERIDDRTGDYSKGMTRKLLLASALMTEPRLAILDEPTSGLDVRNARQVRETIKQYPVAGGAAGAAGRTDGARGDDSDAGRAVLLSSHNMLEVEYLCDRVGLLDEGRIAATGTPAELVDRYGVDNLEHVFLEATA